MDNDEYAQTGEIYSLYTAREELRGDVLILYGDLIFDETCVDRLLSCRKDVSILVDRSFRDEPVDARPAVSARDFVVEKDPFFTARRAIPSREPGVAVRVGVDVTRGDAHAEFVGMLRLSEAGAETVQALLGELAAGGWDQPFQGAHSAREAGLPHLLQELIDRGEEVATVEIYKGWLEIDSLEDLQLALRMLSQ